MEITFELTIPTVNVKTIDLRDLRGIIKDLKSDPVAFRGIRPLEAGERYVLRGKSIVIPDAQGDITVASVGDFLLRSSNGFSAITANPQVAAGDFRGVATELFIPNQGRVLQQWS